MSSQWHWVCCGRKHVYAFEHCPKCGLHWSKAPPALDVWGQPPSGYRTLPGERSPKPKKAALEGTQKSSVERSRPSRSRKGGGKGDKGGKGGKGEESETAPGKAQTEDGAEEGTTKFKLR